MEALDVVAQGLWRVLLIILLIGCIVATVIGTAFVVKVEMIWFFQCDLFGWLAEEMESIKRLLKKGEKFAAKLAAKRKKKHMKLYETQDHDHKVSFITPEELMTLEDGVVEIERKRRAKRINE